VTKSPDLRLRASFPELGFGKELFALLGSFGKKCRFLLSLVVFVGFFSHECYLGLHRSTRLFEEPAPRDRVASKVPVRFQGTTDLTFAAEPTRM
jgi:hypothetical protein